VPVGPPPTCQPSKEVCDGQDNDCNGLIDDQIGCERDWPDGGDPTDMFGDGSVGDPGDPDELAVGVDPSSTSGCTCRTTSSERRASKASLLGFLALAIAVFNRRRAR